MVEDDPDAAHVLAEGLREQAYAVDVAPTVEARLSRPPRTTTTASFST